MKNLNDVKRDSSFDLLLSFYRNIHSSDKCWAVMAAKDLLEKGINPVGHPKLTEIPKID